MLPVKTRHYEGNQYPELTLVPNPELFPYLKSTVTIAQDPGQPVDTSAPEHMLRIFGHIGIRSGVVLFQNILLLPASNKWATSADIIASAIEKRFKTLFDLLLRSDINRVVIDCRKGDAGGHYLAICLDRSVGNPSDWDITVLNAAMLNETDGACYEGEGLKQLLNDRANKDKRNIRFSNLIYQFEGIYKQSSNTACCIAMWLNTQHLLEQSLPGYAGESNDYNAVAYKDMWMRERYIEAYYATLLHSYATGGMKKENSAVAVSEEVSEDSGPLVLDTKFPWALLYEDHNQQIETEISQLPFPPRPQNQPRKLPQLPPLSPEWQVLAGRQDEAVTAAYNDNFPTGNRELDVQVLCDLIKMKKFAEFRKRSSIRVDSIFTAIQLVGYSQCSHLDTDTEVENWWNSKDAKTRISILRNVPEYSTLLDAVNEKLISGYSQVTATLASTVAPAQPQPQPQPYNTLQQLPLPSGILRECINTDLLTDLSGNPQYKEYSESLTQLFADMCSYVYEKFSATTSISSANDIDSFFAYWINVGGDDLENKISAREAVLRQCANGKYQSILDYKPKGSTTGIPCKNSDDSMVVWPLSKPSPSLAPYAAIFGKSPVPATPSAQFLNDKEITIKLNGGIVKERLGALDRNTSDDNSLREVITDILIRVRSVESGRIFSFSKKKGQYQNLIEVIRNESNRDAWYEHLYAAANGDQCSDYNYSSLGYSFTGGILFNGLMENAIIRCLALVIDFQERMSPVQTGSHKPPVS